MSTPASTSQTLLDEAVAYLQNEVHPHANDIDADPLQLRKALDGLCKHGWMALRRPEQFGGPALSEPEFRQFQESVARYSGSLAFLQTQHQSAVGMLSKNASDDLKARLLPKMANGDYLLGIGFSQLRRPGDPIMKAEPQGDGYLLNGHVPWVTGHSFFHDFIIGATLPTGESMFAIVPFVDSSQPEGGSIVFNGPMRLAAMESPQTMSAELKNWIIKPEDVAYIQPDGWIQNNDMINVTLQAWFALGCARAGLDIVEKNYERRKSGFIQDAFTSLDQELGECRTRCEDQTLPLEERIAARAWAIDLCARCAHAGVITSSGAANSVRHDAQRVYREALVYTVSAQTAPIMEASLQRLVARGS